MEVQLVTAMVSGAAIALFALYFARMTLSRPEDIRIRRLAEPPKVVSRGLSSEQVMRRGASSLPFLRPLLENSAWAGRIEREIEQAGLKLRVGEYIVGRCIIGLVVFVMMFALGRSPVAFVIGILCGVIGFLLPAYWLTFLRKRRVERIAKQLPEAVTMIANALKAGFAFQHGIDMVAKQMEPPISEEFTRVMVDMNLGASVEEALYAMLARADSEDMNLVVTAIMIQRTSGGNLSEILETVGETMRERERLLGEVKTMTSQQRFSGTVLTLWPLFILAMFSMFNWKHTSLLFTTNAGLVLITVGIVLQAVGYYAIRRILDVEI